MKSLQSFILEAKESINVGGITFKEGDKVIYLKTYTDEVDGEEYEEEIFGTIDEIYPSKKVNINFGNNKYAVIPSTDLVGLCIPARTRKFRTSYNTETKYQDQLDDINYQIDNIVNQIEQINADMEEQIIDTARQAWLEDNPNKTPDDFNYDSADKYIDKAGSEWAKTSGLNDLEKELKSLEKQRETIQKKLGDYIAKDGKIISKEGTIKYVQGYTPIE